MSSLNPIVPLHFLVPGFSKCGTTTLCALLAEHPQLFMPSGDAKEPRFFDKPDFHQRWSEYAQFFSDAQQGSLLGEGSPSYSDLHFGEAARRSILNLYPNIKLIFIVRDPIDRIESSFREFHHSGQKYGVPAPYELHKALETFPQIIEDSRFLTRINNYRDHLPADQILVVFLEDLNSQPNTVLAKCFGFLGVDSTVEISDAQRQLNQGNEKLYDTQKLRNMRNYVLNPGTSIALHKLDIDIQDQFLEPLGLRQRFTHAPLDWDQKSLDRVIGTLQDEIPVFLETFGKPRNFWPRFTQALNQVHSTSWREP